MTPERSADRPHGRVVQRDDFRPAGWLPGPHLPTIWASVCRRLPTLGFRRQRVELDDGDFVDLAWGAAASGPLVLILHGLEGSVESNYARGLMAALAAQNYRAVLMHFRGCSGEPNRLARNYHSGDTGDLARIVDWLTAQTNQSPLAVIGFSLGGNVLLKWLGECGSSAPLTTAIAVSPPFDLAACATRLNQGFSRFYQWRLVRSMQDKYRLKFSQQQSPLSVDDVGTYNTFWRYDDAITAPLHGFRDADDYYQQSSCRPFLAKIDTPTLIVHALNDPFVPVSAVPLAAELATLVTLELTAGGGHVGFIGGVDQTTSGYWLETRIVQRLREFHH